MRAYVVSVKFDRPNTGFQKRCAGLLLRCGQCPSVYLPPGLVIWWLGNFYAACGTLPVDRYSSRHVGP